MMRDTEDASKMHCMMLTDGNKVVGLVSLSRGVFIRLFSPKTCTLGWLEPVRAPIMCERHPVWEMKDGFLYVYCEIVLFLWIPIMFSLLFVFWKMSLFPNKKRSVPFFCWYQIIYSDITWQKARHRRPQACLAPKKWKNNQTAKNKQKLWYMGQKIMNCDVMCSWRLPVGLLMSWNGIKSLWHFCKVIILISWQLPNLF